MQNAAAALARLQVVFERIKRLRRGCTARIANHAIQLRSAALGLFGGGGLIPLSKPKETNVHFEGFRKMGCGESFGSWALSW